jgi:hypothetical protein
MQVKVLRDMEPYWLVNTCKALQDFSASISQKTAITTHNFVFVYAYLKNVNSSFRIFLIHILYTILDDMHSFVCIPLFRFFRSSKKSLYKFCSCHPTWVVQPMIIPKNSTPLPPNDHRSGKANIRLFIHIDLHRKDERYMPQIYMVSQKLVPYGCNADNCLVYRNAAETICIILNWTNFYVLSFRIKCKPFLSGAQILNTLAFGLYSVTFLWTVSCR